MWEDPIIAEIHRIRQELLDRFDGDLDRYAAYLQERERQHPERLITAEEWQRLKAKGDE